MAKRTKYRPQANPLRRKAVKPIHPKDHYWFAQGAKYGKDKRRKLSSTLDKVLPLTRIGGTFILRYRDMFEAGFNKVRSQD